MMADIFSSRIKPNEMLSSIMALIRVELWHIIPSASIPREKAYLYTVGGKLYTGKKALPCDSKWRISEGGKEGVWAQFWRRNAIDMWVHGSGSDIFWRK